MKRLLILCCSLIFLNGYAQQDGLFSQYMFNGLVLNPAYAGSRDVLSMVTVYRNQWAGIEGAPKTLTLSAHSPLKNKRTGLGITIFNNRLGVYNQTGAYGMYAYRIKFDKGWLSMGIQAGVTSYQANWSEETTIDADDPAFAYNSKHLWAPNFGFGVYYKTRRFYAGGSLPRLIKTISLNSGDKINSKNPGNLHNYYLLTSGYVFEPDPDVKIRPSVLVKYMEGLPIQLDINLNIFLYETLWVGGSYRSGNTFALIFEYQLKQQMTLGYSYDILTRNLGKFSSGSHEVMLRYELNFEQNSTQHPRLF